MPAKAKVIEKVSPSRQIIDQLIKETNDRLSKGGSQGRVYRGNQIRYVECERLPSGSLGLDVIMGGGLPKSRFVEFHGEESAGKTTMAACAAAAIQKENPFANILIAAAEGFDKDWWRTQSLYVPYSDDEFEYARIHKPDELESMEEYNTYADQYGEVVVQQIMAGDALLEEFYRYAKKGIFDLGVIDSLGAIRPAHAVDEDDEKYREVGDDDMGGQAKMMARFAGKMDACFNTKVVTPENPDGEPNKICVIGINQVRAKIGGFSKYPVPPEPTGGHALRHLKSVAIRFSKGPLLREAGKATSKVYGRTIRAECTKNKTSAPHRDCEFNFHFDEYDGFIGVDRAREVAELGVYTGVIEQSGAWYSLNGDKVANGKDKLSLYLRENPEIMDSLIPEIIRLSR